MCMPQDPIFKTVNKYDPVSNGLGISKPVAKLVSRTGPQSNILYRRSLVLIGSHDPAKKPADVWTAPGQTRGYGLTINRGVE